MANAGVSSGFQLADTRDMEEFFSRLRKLDVNSSSELASFLEDYKYRKLVVSGFNRDLVIVGRDESAVFEDFTLQVWKKYYIDEDVVQIGVLQGSLSFPVEVSSGHVIQWSVCLHQLTKKFVKRFIVKNKPRKFFDCN